MERSINKYKLIIPIFLLLLCSGVVHATYALLSTDVQYNNNSYDVRNVQDALDDLYNMVEGNESNIDYPLADVVTWKYDYIGDSQLFTVPYNGKYKLEVWGAQGADADETYIGGYGGYSVGVYNAQKGTRLFINVGGEGGKYTFEQNVKKVAVGGYNGGGYGIVNSNNWYFRYLFAGGGATHIALNSGLLSTLEGHKNDNRILIVAGGGGSGSNQQSVGYNQIDESCYGGACGLYERAQGGSGGGFKGARTSNVSVKWTNSNGHTVANDNGGTQSSGYSFGQGVNKRSSVIDSNGNIKDNLAMVGGGGGYYGGKDGAGGSGYIASANLISSNGVTKHMTCYNCETSSDANTKTNTNDCHNLIPTADCAKEGNGFVRITYLGNS